MPEYQVFHQQAVKSFSAGEDNEHQRRWTESQWEAKASNKKFTLIPQHYYKIFFLST